MKGLPRSMGRSPKTAPGLRRVTIPIKALAFNTTDAGASNAWGTVPVATLPEGNILIVGALANIILTGTHANILATFTANISLGTAATADATLSGTEVDVIASTAVSAATASVSPLTRAASAVALMVDNTDKSKNLNLNVSIPDASSAGNGTMKADGVLHITYVVMGDD